MIFTAQGIPFFLSGEEFARTKPVEGSDELSENSYNLPLYTNSMKYDELEQNLDLYEYYKGLIAFRKAHKGLRFGTAEEVQKNLHFIDNLPKNVVAFTIETEEETLLVAYNANPKAAKTALPIQTEWEIYIEADKASDKALRSLTAKTKQVEVKGISCLVAACR